MPLRKKPRRPFYMSFRFGRVSKKVILRILLFSILMIALLSALKGISFLGRLTSEMAMSDAMDMVIMAINETVRSTMAQSDYDYDYFVSMEKDTSGNITAVSANMAHINAVSAEILSKVIDASESGKLDLRVPLGNLLGSSLLLGKGPDVPVEVITLTSSFVDIENELIATGINQAKHKIVLKINVDIDILIPWDVLSTRVESSVLIAETVIVGKVPETYVSVE